MSYCSPFILLYIIDQHKPKPLENSEKYLIFFLLRFSLNKRRQAPLACHFGSLGFSGS